MENLALFISDDGVTAATIIDACKQGGRLYSLINPVLVISSRETADGFGRVLGTHMLKIDDVIVKRPKDFPSEKSFGKALIGECASRRVTIFGQYGWMEKTPINFLGKCRGISQHSCPLNPGHPDFGGEEMFGRRCLLARLLFVRLTGRNFWTSAIAQRAHPDSNKGAILKEQRVEILPGDDPETLQARILPVEHHVQIETLRDFAEGNVQEIPGTELVLPHEMAIWKMVCELAKLAYPNR